MTSPISAADAARFRDDGYLVLPEVLPVDGLRALQIEADLAVEYQEARMQRGDPVDTINHWKQHYFIPRRSLEREVIRRYVLGDWMADLCRELVGPDAFLFTELFVCKEPRCTLEFGWHQDTGYVHAFGFDRFPPNVTVWTALDDVTADNGALWVRPFSEGGATTVVPHHADAGGHQVADHDGGPVRVLPVPAGSVVVLAGTVLHKSDPNRTDARRRAHLCQFGPVPILAGGRPIQLADPLLRGGQRVSS